MAISRQELKSDQFVSTLDTWYEFYLNYQRQIWYGAIVAVVILVAAYAIIAWHRGRQAHAQALLAAGLDAYHAPLIEGKEAPPPGIKEYASAQSRAAAAGQLFQQVAARYGSTRTGQLAKYYLALTEMDQQRDAVAEKSLRALMRQGDPSVASLAANALANFQAGQGKTAQAEQVLRQLVAHPTTLVPKTMSQLELAGLLASTNPAGARQIYQQIQQADPNSQTAQLAARQLAQLPEK